MIAVTGASGLLGSYIIRRLLDEQIPFVALKRRNSDVSLVADINSRIHWREADITDAESLLEALKDVTGVIHAAAVVSYHKKDKDSISLVNVEGTRNVVNACIHLRIARLLHVSSVAALGRSSQSIVNEDSKWIDGVKESNYAISKYRAELEVWRGREEGLPCVIVNPSVILAPTDWTKSSAQLFKYAWDERPFYTDGSFSAVDVRDVALCTVRLYQSSIDGERFIITSEKTSYLNFFQKAASHFGKKPPSIKVGRSLLKLAAAVESVRGVLTGSTPLVTYETAWLAGRHFTYSNEKIKKALGIEFQSIDDTIAWCCQEYLKKIPVKK
jgi:nucleoside-diphosphate-sugar epimerase